MPPVKQQPSNRTNSSTYDDRSFGSHTIARITYEDVQTMPELGLPQQHKCFKDPIKQIPVHKGAVFSSDNKTLIDFIPNPGSMPNLNNFRHGRNRTRKPIPSMLRKIDPAEECLSLVFYPLTDYKNPQNKTIGAIFLSKFFTTTVDGDLYTDSYKCNQVFLGFLQSGQKVSEVLDKKEAQRAIKTTLSPNKYALFTQCDSAHSALLKLITTKNNKADIGKRQATSIVIDENYDNINNQSQYNDDLNARNQDYIDAIYDTLKVGQVITTKNGEVIENYNILDREEQGKSSEFYTGRNSDNSSFFLNCNNPGIDYNRNNDSNKTPHVVNVVGAATMAAVLTAATAYTFNECLIPCFKSAMGYFNSNNKRGKSKKNGKDKGKGAVEVHELEELEINRNASTASMR